MLMVASFYRVMSSFLIHDLSGYEFILIQGFKVSRFPANFFPAAKKVKTIWSKLNQNRCTSTSLLPGQTKTNRYRRSANRSHPMASLSFRASFLAFLGRSRRIEPPPGACPSRHIRSRGQARQDAQAHQTSNGDAI